MGQLRTRKRGKTWEWSFEGAKVDGKRQSISKGGYRTKAEAIEAGTQAKAEYDNAGRVFTPSEISLSDYLKYWLENYVKVECRPNTYTAYEGVIRIHLIPYIGKYRLSSVAPDILQEHLNKLYAKGLSKNYLKDICGVLSGALRYAVHPLGYIKENPMQFVRLPRCTHEKSDTNRHVITKEQFGEILQRFPQGTQYYILFMICYYTGLRIAECTGLTWSRIDLKENTITVDRILTKNNKIWYLSEPKTQSSNRTIKIGNALSNTLRIHRKWQLENRIRYGKYYKNYYIKSDRSIYGLDSNVKYQSVDDNLEFVCTQENGTLVNPDLSRYASRIVNYDLGIQFNFHSLRHTHATILIENGANIKDVQKRLGHAQLRTTMDTYVHDTDEMQNQSVDIFEKAVVSTS